jgi:hypothetical protein
MLSAEASWEPLKGTTSGQAGVAFLMAAQIASSLHTFGVGISLSLRQCGGERLIKVGLE